MRFTNVIFAAFMATTVSAHANKLSVLDLAERDPAVLSIGTSPGCAATCPVCGDETCACGSRPAGKTPCCNGYGAPKGVNSPGCIGPSTPTVPTKKKTARATPPPM